MSTERPHLLLVDDGPEMGLIVGRYCRLAGWELTTCRDGETALTWLEDRRPNLVLLDLSLPGADGVAVCRRLRARPAGTDLWVALYAQWGTTGDIPSGLDAGADFVVAKDLAARPDAWTHRVGEILRRTHGRTRRRPVAWQGKTDDVPLSADWPAALARAVRHPALRPVGADVQLWLVRRGLADAFAPSAPPPAWRALLEGGRPRGGLLQETRAPAVAAALAVQVWCFMGAEAGAPILEALQAAVPGLSELLR